MAGGQITDGAKKKKEEKDSGNTSKKETRPFLKTRTRHAKKSKKGGKVRGKSAPPTEAKGNGTTQEKVWTGKQKKSKVKWHVCEDKNLRKSYQRMASLPSRGVCYEKCRRKNRYFRKGGEEY